MGGEVGVLDGVRHHQVDLAADDALELIDKLQVVAQQVMHLRKEVHEEVQVASVRIKAPGGCGSEDTQPCDAKRSQARVIAA